MQNSSRRPFRRTARVGAVTVAAAALSFALTAPGSAAPGAQDGFNAGTGTAIALSYKVNPLFGNLSFGITAGESVAGHQNTGASAQSKAINLGVIGITLAGEGCEGAKPTLPEEDQPQPVIVTTDDPKSADGKYADVLGVPNLITMRARATKAPFSEAITTIAPIGDPSGVRIAGSTATATSGVVQAGVREAKAISEIDEISLFNGLLTLKGLRWEAIQRTGGTTTNSGTFSLGSINLAGNAIPLPPDPLSQLSVLKDALGALGFTITPPVTRVEQGIVFVEPMRIGIIPSTLRDTIVSGILGGLSPVRQAFTKLLADIGCGSDNNIIGNNGKSAVTILDLALASISGAGALTLEVGGVQATTSEIAGFSGLGVVPPLPALPPLDSGLPSLPSDTNLPVVPSGPTTRSNSGGTAAKPIAERDDDGERGGVLLAIGAGGLLLMLLTAEADRRKMRQAQREIPLEA